MSDNVNLFSLNTVWKVWENGKPPILLKKKGQTVPSITWAKSNPVQYGGL